MRHGGATVVASVSSRGSRDIGGADWSKRVSAKDSVSQITIGVEYPYQIAGED